ncbi:hypothetical protein ACOMHN_051998 [Nucella lapillus]
MTTMNHSDILIDTLILSPEVTYTIDVYSPSNTSGSAGADDTSPTSSEVSPSLASTRFMVQTIITPIVVTVGLLGNILNILVLVQPTMRTSTNVYLLTLSIADCVYLIFSFTLSFVGCRRRGLSYAAYAFNTYGRTISDMAGNIAVWIIVIFTVERYVAVCHPLHGKVWCTVRRAKLFSLVSALVCVVNTVPGFFELHIVMTAHGHRCRYTAFATSPAYELGYTWWYVTIFTFLPFTFLLIFNSLLIHTLVKAARHRQHMLTDGVHLQMSSYGSRGSTSGQRLSGRSNRRPGAPHHHLPASSQHVPVLRCLCWCSCARAEDPQDHRRLRRQAGLVNADGENVMKNGVHNGTVPSTTSTARADDLDDELAPRHKSRVNRARTLQYISLSSLRCAGKRRDARCSDTADLARKNNNANPLSCSDRGEAPGDSGCDLVVDRGGRVSCVTPSPLPLSTTPHPAPTPPLTHSPFSLLSHQSSESPRQSRRSREQHKVTLMLIVIVIIFLLCQLPWTILYLYRAYLSAHDASSVGNDDIKIAGNVVNLLAQVNASCNFYLYSFFSKRFRRTLARLFLFWKRELSNTSLLHM